MSRWGAGFERARDGARPPIGAGREAWAAKPAPRRDVPRSGTFSATLAASLAPCPAPMSPYNPRHKIATRTRLTEVRYEIRGELARRARELEG